MQVEGTADKVKGKGEELTGMKANGSGGWKVWRWCDGGKRTACGAVRKVLMCGLLREMDCSWSSRTMGSEEGMRWVAQCMAAQMEENIGTARGSICCGEDFATDGR